jgi:hypothetical protein
MKANRKENNTFFYQAIIVKDPDDNISNDVMLTSVEDSEDSNDDVSCKGSRH